MDNSLVTKVIALFQSIITQITDIKTEITYYQCFCITSGYRLCNHIYRFKNFG